MLQPIETLDNPALAVGLAILDVLAYDTETQAKLKKSKGRRKAGRPAKYHVLAPNGRVYHYQRLPPSLGFSQVCHFTAMTDEEAIEKANQMFPEHYVFFREHVYKPEVVQVD